MSVGCNYSHGGKPIGHRHTPNSPERDTTYNAYFKLSRSYDSIPFPRFSLPKRGRLLELRNSFASICIFSTCVDFLRLALTGSPPRIRPFFHRINEDGTYLPPLLSVLRSLRSTLMKGVWLWRSWGPQHPTSAWNVSASMIPVVVVL